MFILNFIIFDVFGGCLDKGNRILSFFIKLI